VLEVSQWVKKMKQFFEKWVLFLNKAILKANRLLKLPHSIFDNALGQAVSFLSMNERKPAVVYGHKGDMGGVTVDLFKISGYPVYGCDIKEPEGLTAIEAAQKGRILFFSVFPIGEIPKIISAIEPFLTSQHVILDNASEKEKLVPVYKTLDQRGISICSTHPMCKHDQPLHGQKVLLMGVGGNFTEAKSIAMEIYGKAGMVMIELPFNLHDAETGATQGFIHWIQRGVGMALEQTEIDPRRLMEIGSANYTLYNESLWRTLIQKEEISAMLIESFFRQESGRKLGRAFLEILGRLMEVAQTEGDLLSGQFKGSFEKLDQNGLSKRMNEETTAILAEIANLQLQSLRIVSPSDEPGTLIRVLAPIAQEGISILTIRGSSRKDGTADFHLALDEKTITPESLERAKEALIQAGLIVENIENNH